MQESSGIFVNGLPLVSSEVFGGATNLTTTSSEDIEQFQVLTSGIPANYDAQGVANLVFKSGTNHIHGSVYENIRNTAFDAKVISLRGRHPLSIKMSMVSPSVVPFYATASFFFGNYDGFKIAQGSTPV